MKLNKVLNVVFAIALFAALIGAIGLLYNGIEMLRYTTFSYGANEEENVMRTALQKPTAIALLIAGLFGILGVAAGVLYLSAKKPIIKVISLAIAVISLVAFVVCLAIVESKWNIRYKESYRDLYDKYKYGPPFYINPTSAILTSGFSIYSTAVAALVQSMIYFVVIIAIAVKDFVQDILINKKSKAQAGTAVENSVISEDNSTEAI